MVGPPDDALPLLEAFHEFSDPELLAELEGKLRPNRWRPRHEKPWNQATNAFFDRLHREDLLCWARHQSPVAPWGLLPGAAWKHIQIYDWQCSTLCREEWQPVQEMHRPIQLVRREGKIFSLQCDPVPVTRNRPCIVERWFDSRVALAPIEIATPMTTQTIRAAEAACRNLLVEMMRAAPDDAPRKNDICDEMRGRFRGLSEAAFARAWADAVKISGATNWRRSGRKS